MLNFIKKYSALIIFILVVTALAFYVIPKQETRYLAPDLAAIKKWSRAVVWWTVGAMVLIAFVYFVRLLKKISELFYLLLIMSWLALSLFFAFSYIITAGVFFLNQLSRESVDRTYRVSFISVGTKQIWLQDSVTRPFSSDRLLNDSNAELRAGDKVTVSFSKGLFGFNFDPVIKKHNLLKEE